MIGDAESTSLSHRTPEFAFEALALALFPEHTPDQALKRRARHGRLQNTS